MDVDVNVDMGSSTSTTINMESTISTTISIDSDVSLNSSPTLIDVIDLTEESPRNRSLQLSQHNRHTENAPTSRHVTRSSRRTSPRDGVLRPIALGRKNTRTYLPAISRRRNDVTRHNEIVTLDNTIEITDDKNKSDKRDNDDKQEDEVADKYYNIQSDDNIPVSLTCPICFEILSSKLRPTTTRCGHIFCAECLKETMRKSKRCPTCKAAITLKTCIRLYL